MHKNSVAICVPVWGRYEETKICLESLFEHTDMHFVHSVNVYDNNSKQEGMQDMIESFDVNYKRGEYRTAWSGMVEMHRSLIDDDSCMYIVKVDNDVEFTCEWLYPILHLFANYPKLASVRYGTSESEGHLMYLRSEGKSGGLKMFKKSLFYPDYIIQSRRFCGSETLSKYLMKLGFECSSIEVGVKMQKVDRSNGE
jgi:GT2 family glycosyltransferase